MNEKERIQKIMDMMGIDEQEARMIMAMADGDIDGDILNGVPLDEALTLGNVVRADKSGS